MYGEGPSAEEKDELAMWGNLKKDLPTAVSALSQKPPEAEASAAATSPRRCPRSPEAEKLRLQSDILAKEGLPSEAPEAEYERMLAEEDALYTETPPVTAGEGARFDMESDEHLRAKPRLPFDMQQDAFSALQRRSTPQEAAISAGTYDPTLDVSADSLTREADYEMRQGRGRAEQKRSSALKPFYDFVDFVRPKGKSGIGAGARPIWQGFGRGPNVGRQR